MSKNEVMLAKQFEAELALLANQSVKAEQASTITPFLSTKSGVLTYRGTPLAGNKLSAVILAAPVERLYYDSRYDPTKIVGPKCWAIAQQATGMRPYEDVETKQNFECESCPKNEWGSATNGGKGKACRETRRLLLIASDSIGTPDSVETAEVAALRPPVTSLKNYATYVQTIAATLKRPPLAVVTEIAVVADPKTQFKVAFNLIEPITSMEVIKALMARAQKEVDKAISSIGSLADNDMQQVVGNTESARF